MDMSFSSMYLLLTHPFMRQPLLSATWPREVKAIASQFVTNHTVHVFIGGVEDKLVANKAISQNIKVSLRLIALQYICRF